MAQASYLYTSLTEGNSQSLSDLSDGLLKYSTTSGVATAATATASTNSADNDYVGGSAILQSLAEQIPGAVGQIPYTTGVPGYALLDPPGYGDILVGDPAISSVIKWLTPGALNQVLTVTAVSPVVTLGWTDNGGGSVTSVAVTSSGSTINVTGSPITGSGTINVDIATVLVAKGGTGQTSYTAGDTLYFASGTSLSKLAIGAANTVLTSSGTAPQWVGGTPSSGNVLTYNGSAVVWAAPTGGTVTSVAIASTDFSVSGSPITTTGTITLNINTSVLTSKGGTGLTGYTAGDMTYYASGTALTKLAIGAANTVLTSSGTAPQWVGGTPSTDDVLTYNGSEVVWAANGSGTVTSVAVSSSGSTIDVTGSPITGAGTINVDIATVLVAKGGTGQTSYTAGDTLYFASGTSLSKLAIGAANTVLTSSGTAPAWVGGTASSGNVLTYNGSAVVWAAPATSGTVTSVAISSTDFSVSGSPITGAGTITLDINTSVLTTKGGTGLTSYTAGDTLYYAASTLLSKLAIGDANTVMTSSGTAPQWVGGTASSGNVLTYNGSAVVWAAPATAGTVTSVAVSSSGSTIDITGSPITGAGTINVDIATVLIAKGGTGITSYTAGDITYFASGTALTKVAIGAANTVLTSSGTAPQWVGGTASSADVLTYNGSAVVWEPPATAITTNGGTGLTSYTAGDTLYYAASTLLSKLAIGAANTVMTSSGTAPQWVGGTATTGQILTYDGANVVWAAPEIPVTQGGAADTVGQATIAAETDSITVNTTAVATGSRILLTIAGFTGTASLALGPVAATTIVNGTSFDIDIATATPAASTVLVNWLIINP